LARLDQIQPPFNAPGGLFPSFTYKLLLDELNASSADLPTALRDLAARALQADHDHFLNTLLEQMDAADESLRSQIDDRSNSLDTALDGLADNLENETRRPNEILEEISSLVRVPLKLDSNQLVQLIEDPRDLSVDLHAQLDAYFNSINISRLINTIEFRLGESLNLNPLELQQNDWQDAAQIIEGQVHKTLDARLDKLLGTDGQIVHEIKAALERISSRDDQAKLGLLIMIAQGNNTAFDSKTHRQVRQVFTRLHYIFLAGELLANTPAANLEEAVLEHLQHAQQAQRRAWGQSELIRLGEAAPTLSSEAIGENLQNQIYRQVLLGAITELWVDYLTRVEALRVSIGLEAYAQSDPLVKYKGQASVMFQTLLTDIRAGIIGRIFLYQPRTGLAQAESSAVPVSGTSPVSTPKAALEAQPSDKKRKRHRH
jgi:preprotein translocase subunit SecA